MVVIVVGCDHDVQSKHHADDPRIESDRRYFRDTVADLIHRYAVKYIGEEAAWDCVTATQGLAQEHSVRYSRIDIPKEAQLQINVRPYPGDSARISEYWLAWQLVREWHMYKTFCAHLEGAQSTMVVCGRYHAPGIINLLTTDLGAEVLGLCLRVTHSIEFHDCCERSKNALPY